MSGLPSGTVTFLFTDIEGSTQLLRRLGDGYAEVLDRHDRLIRAACAGHGGREINTQGDAFFVAFERARDAVSAAVEVQRALVSERWPEGVRVRVRMGLHTGEPRFGGDNYVGLAVHRAARICGVGHGGQVLLSSATRELLEDDPAPSISFRDLGTCRLKDFDRPVHLFQLVVDGLPAAFPPPTSDAAPEAGPSYGASEMLERSSQLSALADSLAAVRSSSRGRLALIGGEAGVGKTTLVGRFCHEHDGAARILWGSCDPLFTPRPLGPLVDIAEGTGGELQDVVASTARPHEVATALMRELEVQAPTIVVLEDLHWADEATLDVLRLLGRRVSGVRALVLATYRDQGLEPADALQIVLGELSGVQAIDRLRVAPLSAGAVATLAAPHGVDADELYRRTAGNPFFVTEALAAGSEQIPQTVRDAVLARSARLSASAREVLEAVAIVPPQVRAGCLTRSPATLSTTSTSA